jgi:hypothetical protein
MNADFQDKGMGHGFSPIGTDFSAGAGGYCQSCQSCESCQSFFDGTRMNADFQDRAWNTDYHRLARISRPALEGIANPVNPVKAFLMGRGTAR